MIESILNNGLTNFINIDLSFNKTCFVKAEFCEMIKVLLAQQTSLE